MIEKLRDNPIVVILGIVSSFLAIFIFITGYDNLSMLLEQKGEVSLSTQPPVQSEPTNIALAPIQTSHPKQSLHAKIAFISDRDTNGLAIYMMELDGTSVIKLTESSNISDLGLTWSLDGQKFAFAKKRSDTQFVTAEIWTINVDGSGLSQMTNTREFLNEYPSWSPDGLRIVFSSAYKGINVIDIRDKRLIQLTNTKVNEVDGSPSWSPDGQHIAFVSNQGNSRYDIFLMNTDGSGITRLTTEPSFDSNPSWSPDSRQIAFVSDRDGNAEIYVMNIDGTNVRRLTNDPATDYQPTWSPDGQEILFVSERDGNEEIYMMKADGNQQTNLTNNPAQDNNPVWSPLP